MYWEYSSPANIGNYYYPSNGKTNVVVNSAINVITNSLGLPLYKTVFYLSLMDIFSQGGQIVAWYSYNDTTVDLGARAEIFNAAQPTRIPNIVSGETPRGRNYKTSINIDLDLTLVPSSLFTTATRICTEVTTFSYYPSSSTRVYRS